MQLMVLRYYIKRKGFVMSKRKVFLLVKILVVMVLFACIGCKPAGAGSEQISCIVVPAQTSAAEQHAADELSKYINRMTGQSVAVVKEGEKETVGRAIILGRTTDNLQKHNPDSWPLDTIYIGYGKGDITIIGQGEQGTLFAAYEFLHDQGCRWYMPLMSHALEAGECIPSRQSLAFPRKPKKHTPSFQDRGWHTTAASAGIEILFKDWAVRNGVNAITAGDTRIKYPPYLGYGRGKAMGHTLLGFLASGNHPSRVERVKEIFAAHPEWYPVVDGKRTWMYRDGRPVQACLSNPEIVEKVAKGVIEQFRDNPRWWVYSLGHNDEPSYWCECEACLAMDGPKSTWKKNDIYDAYPRDPQCKNGPGAMSSRYVKFVNQVARIVAKEFPDKYISFYAYGSTHSPPRDSDWTLESNVVAEYADSGHCLRHGFDDTDCQNNTSLVKWLDEWTSKGKVMYYDYPPMGGNFNLPTILTHSYKRYLSYFKKAGVIGFSGENQGVWGGAALFHYLEARLLWDVDTDVDKVVKEFCRDMYGPAAATMERFYNTFEQKLQELPGHLTYGHGVPDFDEDTMQTLSGYLDQARQQADSPLVQKRLKMIQVSMNCFVMAKMEANPGDQAGAAAFEDYNQLRSETLKMIEEINLPSSVVVTPQFIDKLKRGAYRPPFEALGGKELLTLPLVWRFRTDPDNVGLKQGWPKTPNANQKTWQDIRVDDYWTEQGLNYHGVAWYATTLKIPAEVEEDLWLLFEILDGDAEIWIDGQSAGKLPGDPWDKPKAVELTKLVKAGGKYQIVVRVVKETFSAGICKSVKLMQTYRIIGDR